MTVNGVLKGPAHEALWELSALGLAHDLRFGQTRKLFHFGTDCLFVGLITEITGDFAVDIFVACLLKVGFHDFCGIGGGVIAGFAHNLSGPEPQKLVPACFCLELHLRVMGVFVLECICAVVKTGHNGLPFWLLVC